MGTEKYRSRQIVVIHKARTVMVSITVKCLNGVHMKVNGHIKMIP